MTLNSQGGALSFEQIKSSLDPTIISMVDQSVIQDIANTEVQKIGFVTAGLYTPDQKVDTAVSGAPFKRMTAGGVHPDMPVQKGGQKVVSTKNYGGKFTIEKEAMKWIQNSDLLNGSDPAVRDFLQNLMTQSKRTSMGINRNLSILATSVLAYGTSVYNPVQEISALSPDGKAFFSATHSTVSGATYDNTIATALLKDATQANIATNRDTILAQINKYKSGVLMDDGYGVNFANTKWKLICTPEYATAVRGALNINKNALIQATSGIGDNANATNLFQFEGNMVEVVENDYLGRPDLDGNALGSRASWFLINDTANQSVGGLRKHGQWEPETVTYLEQDTQNLCIVTDFNTSLDFFVPQVAMGYVA